MSPLVPGNLAKIQHKWKRPRGLWGPTAFIGVSDATRWHGVIRSWAALTRRHPDSAAGASGPVTVRDLCSVPGAMPPRGTARKGPNQICYLLLRTPQLLQGHEVIFALT